MMAVLQHQTHNKSDIAYVALVSVHVLLPAQKFCFICSLTKLVSESIT